MTKVMTPSKKSIQNSNTGLPTPKFHVLPAYISQLFLIFLRFSLKHSIYLDPKIYVLGSLRRLAFPWQASRTLPWWSPPPPYLDRVLMLVHPGSEFPV